MVENRRIESTMKKNGAQNREEILPSTQVARRVSEWEKPESKNSRGNPAFSLVRPLPPIDQSARRKMKRRSKMEAQTAMIRGMQTLSIYRDGMGDDDDDGDDEEEEVENEGR